MVQAAASTSLIILLSTLYANGASCGICFSESIFSLPYAKMMQAAVSAPPIISYAKNVKEKLIFCKNRQNFVTFKLENLSN